MRTATTTSSRTRALPLHLPLGLAVVAGAWWLAWFGPAPYAHYTFTTLWLGYILTVDGLTVRRAGTSLLTRDPARFALLFAFSAPLWWLFEAANVFLGNWEYRLHRDYNLAQNLVIGSVRFSTVMPALFVTATLWRTFPTFRREIRWRRADLSRNALIATAALGVAMIAGSLIFADILFPLIWIGLFLLLDAVNRLTGAASIAEQLARGRWDTVLVLFAAGLTCGFFWEMWNVRSLPKWVYDVPHVGFFKVFEMPILGYGGYLPFALEVFAAYHLLHTLLFRRRDTYVTFDDPLGP